MLHTDICHCAVGREHPRNGRRATIADAFADETQLGIEIAPHLRMDAVKRGQTLVSSPLCIAASTSATAGNFSARATASRPNEGERQRGATEWHPKVEWAMCIRVPSRPSHSRAHRCDRRPAGRWRSRVGEAQQMPERRQAR